MKLSKYILSAFLVVFIFSSCNKYGKIAKSKDFAFKLQMADKYFANKKYRYAQELYEELYPVYKGTDKFEEIYFKDAYCFYYLQNYRDAENFFKGFLEVFPNSTRAEEVDYMHAYCFYKQSPKLELDQSSTSKSIGVMQTFIATHPNSARNKDAAEIIDKCRAKLELKEARAADLYFKVGQYRAAALSYTELLNDYPESINGDQYKFKTIKSYYLFSKLSISTKQVERYNKVITEYQDFVDRYPQSSLLKSAELYNNLSKNNIKEIENEQAKTSTKL